MHAATAHIVGLVRVGQRIARGRRGQVIVNRRDDRLEVSLGVGERGAPEAPVGLSKLGARVQGHAVALHDFLVIGDFPLRRLWWEDVQTEDTVPGQVVFLAPGVRLVEGEAIVVALGGYLHPMLRIRPREREIFLRVCGVASHPAQIAVGSETQDRFDREIGVVGQVAHEVVGAELVLRVQAVLLQVICPLRQLRPPRRDEFRIAFRLRDGIAEQKHVAAFLHWHALAAVVATGDKRIGAQIVRRIRELPVRGGGIHQDVNERRLGQGGAEQYQHRVHWIEHVHGGDIAIAGVLFGEVERLLVRVGGDAAGGQRLTVGQRRNLGVAGATCFGQVRHELAVELLAALDQARIIPLRGRKQVGRRRAIAPPVGPQLLAVVPDGINLVIGH